MSDIELVIKIPKEAYENCKAQEDAIEIQLAVKNGTLLPKGHWTYYQNEKGNWINECSVCKCDAGVGYPYRYCPNCRAEMTEE